MDSLNTINDDVHASLATYTAPRVVSDVSRAASEVLADFDPSFTAPSLYIDHPVVTDEQSIDEVANAMRAESDVSTPNTVGKYFSSFDNESHGSPIIYKTDADSLHTVNVTVVSADDEDTNRHSTDGHHKDDREGEEMVKKNKKNKNAAKKRKAACVRKKSSAVAKKRNISKMFLDDTDDEDEHKRSSVDKDADVHVKTVDLDNPDDKTTSSSILEMEIVSGDDGDQRSKDAPKDDDDRSSNHLISAVDLIDKVHPLNENDNTEEDEEDDEDRRQHNKRRLDDDDDDDDGDDDDDDDDYNPSPLTSQSSPRAKARPIVKRRRTIAAFENHSEPQKRITFAADAEDVSTEVQNTDDGGTIQQQQQRLLQHQHLLQHLLKTNYTYTLINDERGAANSTAMRLSILENLVWGLTDQVKLLIEARQSTPVKTTPKEDTPKATTTTTTTTVNKRPRSNSVSNYRVTSSPNLFGRQNYKLYRTERDNRSYKLLIGGVPKTKSWTNCTYVCDIPTNQRDPTITRRAISDAIRYENRKACADQLLAISANDSEMPALKKALRAKRFYSEHGRCIINQDTIRRVTMTEEELISMLTTLR